MSSGHARKIEKEIQTLASHNNDLERQIGKLNNIIKDIREIQEENTNVKYDNDVLKTEIEELHKFVKLAGDYVREKLDEDYLFTMILRWQDENPYVAFRPIEIIFPGANLHHRKEEPRKEAYKREMRRLRDAERSRAHREKLELEKAKPAAPEQAEGQGSEQ